MGPELLADRYELHGVLGRGGMAEVRDGWDTRLHRTVAIKLLHPGMSADPDGRRRFEAEARSAAALNHPNIVAVHDSGEYNGTPFIVMERLPGVSLADHIARGPLPHGLVRSVLGEVLGALAAAHAAGILHRDVKPANILFTTNGQTKLADFGIAKSSETHNTVNGQILGTMAYLSPDRLAGKPATPEDDLYAVGVVGYEALTGRKPFMQDNLLTLARAILDGRAPPVAALRPDVDPVLATVVERSMAREPAARFADAMAMRAALSAERGWPTMTPPARPSTKVLTTPMPPTGPPSMAYVAQHGLRRPPAGRRRRGLLVGLGALLAVVVTALAFALDPSSQHVAPNQPAATTSSATPTPVSTTVTTTPSSNLPTVTTPPAQHGNGHKKGKGGG